MQIYRVKIFGLFDLKLRWKWLFLKSEKGSELSISFSIEQLKTRLLTTPIRTELTKAQIFGKKSHKFTGDFFALRIAETAETKEFFELLIVNFCGHCDSLREPIFKSEISPRRWFFNNINSNSS